jgi:hypothetical protein
MIALRIAGSVGLGEPQTIFFPSRCGEAKGAEGRSTRGDEGRAMIALEMIETSSSLTWLMRLLADMHALMIAARVFKSVREAHRQLPRAKFGLIQRQVDNLTANSLRDAVPNPIRP